MPKVRGIQQPFELMDAHILGLSGHLAILLQRFSTQQVPLSS